MLVLELVGGLDQPIFAVVVLVWVGGKRRIWPGVQQPDRVNETGQISPKGWTIQIILILLLHSMVRNWPYWSEALERCRLPSSWGLG